MDNKNYKELLKDITTFIFDIDGVLTQCQVLVTNEGDLLRSFNVKDGYAIKQAINQGYRIAIITGGNNIGTRLRFEQLGVTDVYMANHLKIEPLKDYMDKYNLHPKEILYMGDDIPDVAPMKLVGLPTCPQDAVPEVKAVARYISHLGGGQGCVREVIEQVMKVFAQNSGYEDESEYWGLVGLLHDLDYEMYPDEHCVKVVEILKNHDIEQDFIDSICSHGYDHRVSIKPEHIMEKTLYAVDELTGLVGACALMRPSKSCKDMELKSLKKKFKDKKFAAGCNRDIILRGAEMMGIEIDDLLQKTLDAMKVSEDIVNSEMSRLELE